MMTMMMMMMIMIIISIIPAWCGCTGSGKSVGTSTRMRTPGELPTSLTVFTCKHHIGASMRNS